MDPRLLNMAGRAMGGMGGRGRGGMGGMGAMAGAMGGLGSMASQMPSFDAMFTMAPITKQQQQHLTQVYSALLLGILASATAVYMRATGALVIDGALPFIGCVLFGMGLGSSRDNKLTQFRIGMFGGFVICKGLSIGSYVSYITHVHPQILPTAFFATVAIFTAFSVCAIFAKSRSWLFLSSILSSISMYMFFLSLFNMYFRNPMAHDVILYGGLLMFLGYVLVDTQKILERSKSGDHDVLRHALELYIDFIAIFVRVLQILARKEEQRKKRND